MSRRSARRCCTAVPAFLLLALAALRADAKAELCRARNRPARELAPLAAEPLEPAGTAFADPGTGVLILKGPADPVRGALELLRTLDVPMEACGTQGMSHGIVLARAQELSAGQ